MTRRRIGRRALDSTRLPGVAWPASLSHHEVHQLAWDDDLLDDLFAVDVRPDVGRLPAQLLQFLRRRIARRLYAVAQLAVDLAHQLVDLPLQQRLVGLRPGHFPYALAHEALIDI